MGGGWGGGYAARLLLFSFPCSADHERGWPPCKVFFSGWQPIHTLNVTVINISVQYNGGFLPDIVLLTPGYYHWEIPCSGFVFIAYVIP